MMARPRCVGRGCLERNAPCDNTPPNSLGSSSTKPLVAGGSTPYWAASRGVSGWRLLLSKLVSVHGSPQHLRSDNGPEFVSRAVLKWLTQANIDTAHIDPGKPWQNGTDESFNGKFRDECLSMEWFRNRIDAKIVIEQFRRQYNEVRPHSSLGQLTPAEFKQQLLSTNHPESAIS